MPSDDCEDVVSRVNYLHNQGNWRGVLNLQVRNPSLLWAWPSEKSLTWLGNLPRRYGHESITSIGCGSGLLEWLIEQATKTRVIPIDLQDSWWAKCPQAPTYVKHLWIDHRKPPSSSQLTPKSVLMFCYFNDERAFSKYVNVYRGNTVVIIGPGSVAERHTAPLPLQPHLDYLERNWVLTEIYDFNQSGDVAAVWTSV